MITGEDIRRSGAKTIIEALQLAPNLQVARTSVSSGAITARGFNGTLANKLLVCTAAAWTRIATARGREASSWCGCR